MKQRLKNLLTDLRSLTDSILDHLEVMGPADLAKISPEDARFMMADGSAKYPITRVSILYAEPNFNSIVPYAVDKVSGDRIRLRVLNDRHVSTLGAIREIRIDSDVFESLIKDMYNHSRSYILAIDLDDSASVEFLDDRT